MVVSTNVAETSITIDGIRIVIDSGLARIARYDPNRGIDTLLVERISRASADQRTGRAGRTAPGQCIRLWTEQEHAARRLQERRIFPAIDIERSSTRREELLISPDILQQVLTLGQHPTDCQCGGRYDL